MKKKPQAVKPVKAWAVFNERSIVDGGASIDGYPVFRTRAEAAEWSRPIDGERVIRVEIREVGR